MLWNAQYIDDAIIHLRATGHEITDENLKRLSPLQHEHIKMLGNFPFTLPPRVGAVWFHAHEPAPEVGGGGGLP